MKNTAFGWLRFLFNIWINFHDFRVNNIEMRQKGKYLLNVQRKNLKVFLWQNLDKNKMQICVKAKTSMFYYDEKCTYEVFIDCKGEKKRNYRHII